MHDEEPTYDNGPAAAMLSSEAVRQLTRQEAALDTLRNRAVAVLSAGSVVAGLFGSRLPAKLVSGAQYSVIAAFVSFGLTATLVLTILWPRNWAFAHDDSAAIELLEKGEPVKAVDLGFSWAKMFDESRRRNQRKLDCLTTLFTWTCALTGVQVLAWGLSIVQPRLFP